MITAGKTVSPSILLLAAIAAAGLAVIVAGIYLFPLMLDEAYITYSHARNFARSGRLVYHPSNPEFSVSTPLYALLLGLGGAAGLPIPAMSKLLGAASIFGSSVYLSLLCYRHRMTWAALTSGLLLATSPLLWQTLGLEACFFLLFVLAAFYHSDRGQFVSAAALTAGAVLTRWEGIFAAGILGFSYFNLTALRQGAPQGEITKFLWDTFLYCFLIGSLIINFLEGEIISSAVFFVVVGGAALYKMLAAEEKGPILSGLTAIFRQVVLQRRVRWNVVLVFLAILVPALLCAALFFGTPVPMVFHKQQGQGAIGFTGYGFGISFLQGLQSMLKGWLERSPLYYLGLPLATVGILSLLSGMRQSADAVEDRESAPAVTVSADLQQRPGGNRSIWWARGIVVWGVLHIAGLALLKLSPYPWSFVPLVPGFAVIAGLALQRLAEWAGKSWLQPVVCGVLLSCLLLAQLILLDATGSSIRDANPPVSVQSDPETTGSVYDLHRAAGEWLNANTPADATVAAVRSGILGYFAERPMIDLSGSLQFEVAQALKRGDPFHAILVLQPDFLVLDEGHFIFDIWKNGNQWFAANYHEAKRFTDEHSPARRGVSLVVLRRLDQAETWDRTTMFEEEGRVAVSYSPYISARGIVIYGSELQPGRWMHVRLDCAAEPERFKSSSSDRETTKFTLRDMNGAVAAEQPLANTMTAYFSRSWREEERYAIYVQLLLPEELEPGTFEFGVSYIDQNTKKEGFIYLPRITVGSGSNG